MDIYEKIILDQLNKDSVSVVKQSFVNIDGTPQKVGEDRRNAFVNSDAQRELLRDFIPEQYLQAVFAVWGKTATVNEAVFEDIPEGGTQA